MIAKSQVSGLAGVCLMVAHPALAHTGAVIGGLATGLLHPVAGIDHVVARIVVGLWGGILGAPGVWALPILFPMAMAVAGAVGAAGIALPDIEAWIALSGIVPGLMVPPPWRRSPGTRPSGPACACSAHGSRRSR